MLTTDPIVFNWAKSLADSLPAIRSIGVIEIEKYVDKLGSHISLYRDDAEDQTYMCICQENGEKLFWRKVTNFKEMVTNNPEQTNLWLRNGEYLYTELIGGKGMRLINIDYFNKNGRKSTGRG